MPSTASRGPTPTIAASAIPSSGRARGSSQGTLLRRAKKRGAARTAIEDAIAGFTAIGTPLWAERARAELERLGLRPSAGALTETESRIAALAASGATNREIAGLMFVSVKTVEANLSRCYRKLGVRSRVELARRLERDEGRRGAPA